MSRYRITLDDVKPLPVTESEGFVGMDSRVLLSDETVGSKDACMFRALFPPGAEHGDHVHDDSDELLYGLSGVGIQTIDGEDYDIRPGVAIFIPRYAVHSMRNVSRDEDLEVLGVYPTAPNLDKTGYRYLGQSSKE
jgi:quercetin dioxygenase-like cupin family protein